MDKKSLKLTETKSKSQVKDKKNLVIGTIIATLIALTPYLFDVYKVVPNVKVWNNFLFSYDSKYYESVQTLAWTLMNKLVPLFLIFVWFFTSRQWWYHALLVPIAMYIYQIMIILNDDLQYVDNYQLLYLIPVMAIVVPSIYLIRARMFDKVNSVGKSMEELEEEFKIKPKGFFGKLKQYF